ncbi:uncharacterized protein F4807DRAFT_464819 [Annulohypoxylon truncatum]|uniref:uncharacterized protein n=1 Tax=Annulohypoxylon truncatum TaxID=327061 RepID=UPI0020077796|nr:uncharacterized protein F4807DRAFT_464819 [Annulohypoxylon truncatum]KAI1205342.1 hypothetical protein F4807DRAFT_464819 [Annulohypoxylon truncatum]
MSDLDFSNLSPSELNDALNGSALKPPEGVTVDFDHPTNKNAVSLVGLIICLVVASISLATRIYVRFYKTRQQHLGDYALAFAYLFWIVVIVGSLRRITESTGLFVHQWEMRGRDMAGYLQIVFMGMNFWVVTMMLVKSSILIEWIRLFAPMDTRTLFHRSCKFLLAFNILFYVSILVALNLTCFPYRRIWDKTVPGSCIDIKIINLVATVINFTLDIAVLLLPQRMIWNLKLSTVKKVGISAVFAVGIFACIAAGCLLDAILEWRRSDDMTYHYSSVALWAIAESTCGILIFCVPAAPKAFIGLKPRAWLSRLGSWTGSFMKRKRLSTIRKEDTWSRTALGSLKPRKYQSIDEPNSIILQGVGSGRPTDQQYGIICTTDIIVTEAYENNHRRGQQRNQFPWLPEREENGA